MKKGLFAIILALALALPASAEDMLGHPVYRTASNPTEAVVFSGDWIKGFTNYRIAVSTEGTVTAGVLEVQVKGGVGGFAVLRETIDLTAPEIMVLGGPVDAIRFDPDGFDGDSYTVEVLGWR